jgi:PAS domain S-box-containing protein
VVKKDSSKAYLEKITDPAALYEDAPCGYVSFLADGEIIKVNQTLSNWLGYHREELVNKLHFKDIISKGGQIYYEMFYFPLLLIQNLVNEISFDYVRKDGSKFPALVNSNVINDSDGKLLVVNATIFNITDRKKYESELLEAKREADTERSKFKSLADFLPELIWTADSTGSVNYVNSRFSNFFGMPEGAGSHELIRARIHTGDRFKLIRNWLKAVQEGESLQVEARIQNIEGVFQWYLIRALADKQLDENSKWIGSCANIDQHVTVIRQLDEFVSVASHELKTPITTLKASLQLISRMLPADSPLSKLVLQANRSAEKVSGMVHDLLNARSIREGQVNLNYSRFSICDLLSNASSQVSAAKDYNLVVHCPLDLKIDADEHRIEQVLVNFINNAIKYAPGSSNIFLGAEQGTGEIKISVRDTGPGIPADKIPFLFDRFYRASNAGSTYSGLGLGLYICAEIIQRHNGKIGVDSVVGTGTTFWFTLPG